MTAGTVVITGGILATVILLCIIVVLCYCRLQVNFKLHLFTSGIRNNKILNGFAGFELSICFCIYGMSAVPTVFHNPTHLIYLIN